MTQLLLKLHQPYAQGFIEAGAVASVRRLSDVKGERVKSSWCQEKPVDIAGQDARQGQYSRFELPGGGYYGVDIASPRGADISREFLIKEDEVRTETITMDVSPHEYLGWQQYAGIVSSHPYSEQKEISRALRFGDTLRISEKGLKQARFAEQAPVPSISAVDLPSSGEAWQLRYWMALPPVVPLFPGLSWPHVDDEFATWFPPMPDSSQGLALIDQLKQPPGGLPAPYFPRWMIFAFAGRWILASIPWAWWGAGRSPDEQMQFLFDRVRPNPVDRDIPGRLTITVQDRRWFGLLQFLSSGRLSRAREVSNTILGQTSPEDALYGKLQGPLCAVAGAIILITQARSSERQQWDGWLENLSNWFPGIPDGAVLLGYRRLQQAKDETGLRGAYEILRTAFERGIPFFSASIRMLALALAQISGEIPEADRLRRAIALVATRVDPDQPFTVIQGTGTP